jgi:hypothetical protein
MPSQRITFRVSDTVHAQLETVARHHGVPVSAVVRQGPCYYRSSCYSGGGK